MRLRIFAVVLIVASASAATVHEYRDDRWKVVIMHRTRPDYPVEARRALLTGQGVFRLSFGRNGRLTSVTTLQSTGHQILDAAAINAFRQWRATPGRRRELDTPVMFAKVWRRDAWPPSSAGMPRTILREFDD